MDTTTTHFDEITDRALQLPQSDRAKLVRRLIDSLDATNEDIPPDEWKRVWGEEIQRRLEAADRGDFVEGDWRDVIEGLKSPA